MCATLAAPLQLAIVEDNPVHRETYRNMILCDDERHTVDVYPDGQSLQEVKAELSRYDCLLFDIKLPDVNGIELSKEIRATYPYLPIIFITAYSSDSEALRTLADGAEDYLPKGEYNQILFMRSIRYAIERKKYQLETQRLSRDLEQQKALNAQQKEFVSMVSHEFRTPLAIIGSSIQLIERYLDDEARAKGEKHVRKIQQGVSRLTGLIDNALCFTRLEEGRIHFQPVSLDLCKLLEETLDNFRQIFPDYTFTLYCDDFSDGFSGDPVILDHVFYNLLSNAVKYSRDHVHEVSVTATREQGACGGVRIDIADKGRGIAPQDMAKIGERFFRAKNSIGTSGSGIGMYIVKRLLEMHGGSLSLESEPEQGTTVSIFLPGGGTAEASQAEGGA